MSLIASVYEGDGSFRLNFSGRLEYLCRLDQWTAEVASAVMLDIDPDSIEWDGNKSGFVRVTMLTGAHISSVEDVSDFDEAAIGTNDGGDFGPVDGMMYGPSEVLAGNRLQELYQDFRDLLHILQGGAVMRETATPAQWVELALAKRIRVPWLRYAKHKGCIAVKQPDDGAGSAADRNGKGVDGKSETSYLNIIGALVSVITEKTDGAGNRYSLINSQAALIDTIDTHFGSGGGLSRSNLEKKFALGKKSISSTK